MDRRPQLSKLPHTGLDCHTLQNEMTVGALACGFSLSLLGLRDTLKSMATSNKESAIVVDPDILGGAYAVFRGTRVPSQNLFNYLKKGYSIEEFLLDFPTVTREQVLATLEFADESIKLRVAS